MRAAGSRSLTPSTSTATPDPPCASTATGCSEASSDRGCSAQVRHLHTHTRSQNPNDFWVVIKVGQQFIYCNLTKNVIFHKLLFHTCDYNHDSSFEKVACGDLSSQDNFQLVEFILHQCPSVSFGPNALLNSVAPVSLLPLPSDCRFNCHRRCEPSVPRNCPGERRDSKGEGEPLPAFY